MKDNKVLVVDDEIHIIHVIAIKLRNNGFDVVSAENGAEAMELARKDRPDIIVTDFQMPIMNGLEFVTNLRQNQELKDIPVIMLTARGFAVTDEQKEELQISECLSKPFSPKELLRCIEDILHDKSVTCGEKLNTSS